MAAVSEAVSSLTSGTDVRVLVAEPGADLEAVTADAVAACSSWRDGFALAYNMVVLAAAQYDGWVDFAVNSGPGVSTPQLVDAQVALSASSDVTAGLVAALSAFADSDFVPAVLPHTAERPRTAAWWVVPAVVVPAGLVVLWLLALGTGPGRRRRRSAPAGG